MTDDRSLTQNRMALAADRRAELDLQVSLLAEAEITKLVEMVSMIAERMEPSTSEQHEIEEMKQAGRARSGARRDRGDRGVTASAIRSAEDGALRAGECGGGGGGAGAGALGEVFGELGVPRASRFTDCAPGGHPLLDRAAPIVTLVRLHLVPLR
ncbi:MAG TPA: DUF1003 domain-containing protein [Stellaceae bacterium]|nr:DUF1003 domain-containing protein [Stellaceae bacterium]